ncbi:conserved membrane protein of unknown function [Nitrospira sp. KM1]|uniref:DUF2062 domain-containing protein n=1 Tax=Nitrospira sp. KM1 TaxID=1936990 RepID=UPI0013A738BB|nr:DUF2062 domain-containing protein [Nitrospira sp. KM1]BCA54262.1 conserved membrane protein of unknown function [Nitrospira sp. KM1]
MPSLRTLLKQVLHLQETPQRTALAFSVGAAIAFCPFYGFHMILVGFCTWAFKLNFVALMAGALVNNPWTLVPTLGATYWVGAVLLNRPDVPSFSWDDLSFTGIYHQVMPYAVPFLVGGLVLSAVAAVIAYPIALYVITKYRRSHAAAAGEPLPPRDRLG